MLHKQLEIVGKEMNEYREKNGIRIRGEDDSKKENAVEKDSGKKNKGSGVLVAQEKTGKESK